MLHPVRLLLLLGLAVHLGCAGDFTDETRRWAPQREDAGALHPVTIHQPTSLGVLDTPLIDARGATIGVACATCHGPTAERAIATADAGRAEVHAGIDVQHGGLTCDACHDTDRTRLRLADGRGLPFADAMDLCAQCHGPQTRDYRRGSHGGMTGYWDLRRGPRARNHCIDCHAPHAPAYPAGVLPVLPPRDRYLGGH